MIAAIGISSIHLYTEKGTYIYLDNALYIPKSMVCLFL